MPAHNKRFGEIGGEVIIRILVCPLTIGDCPNCVRLIPNFAKPPGRCVQCGGSVAAKRLLSKKTAFDYRQNCVYNSFFATFATERRFC
jgi:hypothetical protein